MPQVVAEQTTVLVLTHRNQAGQKEQQQQEQLDRQGSPDHSQETRPTSRLHGSRACFIICTQTRNGKNGIWLLENNTEARDVRIFAIPR